MLIEWVKALVPIVVALIPVVWAVIKTARETRASTAKQIEAVSEKLDAHVKADEWNEMKQRRVRILRFADEVGSGRKYSSEMWDDILDDIDGYEAYCESHKDYHNNKGVMAMEFIKIEYMKMKGVYKDGTAN